MFICTDEYRISLLSQRSAGLACAFHSCDRPATLEPPYSPSLTRGINNTSIAHRHPRIFPYHVRKFNRRCHDSLFLRCIGVSRRILRHGTVLAGPACGSIWEAHPEYTNGCTKEDSTISTSRTYTLTLHLWVRLCRNYVFLWTPKYDVTIRPVLAQGSVCGELEI